jgi:hypothetical protein
MPRISASLRSAGSIVGRGRIRSPRAANAVAGGAAATVPAAPSAFAQTNQTTAIGSGPTVVSWTAPNNGGATITSYSITYKWISQDSGEAMAPVTLHTTSQAGTSYSIAEALNHGWPPDNANVGSQPRWREGNVGYSVIVTATNSVGTGPAGTYGFNTSGGS